MRTLAENSKVSERIVDGCVKDANPAQESHAVIFTKRIEEFLHNVQKAYDESLKSCASCSTIGEKNVIRGRARCISGRVEDLFAEALYDVLKDSVEELRVFVDLPLSYERDERDDKGNKQKGICYPDVVVAQAKSDMMKVLYLVELKVDLGWGRHMLAGEVIHNGERVKVTPIEEIVMHKLQELIGVKTWCKTPFCMKTWLEKDELQFVVSKDTRYDLIICSSKNVSQTALQKARERIGDNLRAVCQMYALSEKELSPKYDGKKKQRGAEDQLCSDDVGKWKSRIDALVEGWKQNEMNKVGGSK